MTPTRREFLSVAAIAVAGCSSPELAGTEDTIGAVEGDRPSFKAVVRKLAESYTGWPYEADLDFVTTRFDAYFDWWADQDPSKKEYYDSVVAALDDAAIAGLKKRFIGCTPAQRISIVAKAFPGERERKAFDANIRRPILHVYTQTYAWIDMGYAGFPSEPRGLDAYQQPPVKASA